ncbi:MAG: aminotransferase class IV [Dehalococcoidia bacterium]
MQRSAAALRLSLDPDIAKLERICLDLLDRNGLPDSSIYLQITRRAAPRVHWMPENLRPTTLVIVSPAPAPRVEMLRDGTAAITIPDDRWARCDVKVIGLRANVLAKQRAIDAGAFEAIYVRDGTVTDCSSCNVFAVFAGTLQTAPNSNYILTSTTTEIMPVTHLDEAPVAGGWRGPITRRLILLFSEHIEQFVGIPAGFEGRGMGARTGRQLRG